MTNTRTRGGGVRAADLPVAKADQDGPPSPESDLHRRPDTP